VADLSFSGKTVLVTGGASGIGAAVETIFRNHGARVYCLDVKCPPDTESRYITGDVTRPADVVGAVDQAIAETGRLDAVVASAGINRDRAVWKLSDEEWRSVMAVNLDGAFHLVRAAIPHFRERRSGAIILISSINGERGKRGQANYAASKAGMIALAKSAARELGSFGIRVNVVAPGFIETPMTRDLPAEIREAAVCETALGRTGSPEDVAMAVLFLCSEMARHITGQVIRVDGGQYM
jgi:3-oxoacyl-[acyl-carrier protein] reductase